MLELHTLLNPAQVPIITHFPLYRHEHTITTTQSHGQEIENKEHECGHSR